jgi:hypothetical protein
MFGGLPIGVVIIVICILTLALYVFLNTPSMFEGIWYVKTYEGELGQQYSEVLQQTTFSLAEDNEHITMHPTNAEPIVFSIVTMEPANIVAESNQEQYKLELEFNVEDPNTNEVSLTLKAITDSKEIKSILYYAQ